MNKTIFTILAFILLGIVTSCSGGDVSLQTDEPDTKFSGELRHFLSLKQGETKLTLKKIKMQGAGDAFLMELPITIQISENAKKCKVDFWGFSLRITDDEGNNLLIIPIGTGKNNRAILDLKEKVKDAINDGQTEVSLIITADVFEDPYISFETGKLLQSKASKLVAYRTDGVILNKAAFEADPKDDVESVAENSYKSQTPLTLKGKIGGKYPIHMTINADRTGGSYYYDKSGPNNALSLTVLEYDNNTGTLKMEERNDKNEITGSFLGTLSSDRYVGTLHLPNGKSFEFSLSVMGATPETSSITETTPTGVSTNSGKIVLTTEEIRIDASLGYNYVYEILPDGTALVHSYTYGYEYGDNKHEHPKKMASNPDEHHEGEWTTFSRKKGNSYQKIYRIDYDGKHRFIPEDFRYSYPDIYTMNSHDTNKAIKIKSVKHD